MLTIPHLLDIKLDNLFYTRRDSEFYVVLANFGIVKTLYAEYVTLNSIDASFNYAAPEVLEEKAPGKPMDLWSAGVVTYILLCGYTPFCSETAPDLLQEHTSSQLVFLEQYWKDISQDARDCILGLVVLDPEKRWTSRVSQTAS